MSSTVAIFRDIVDPVDTCKVMMPLEIVHGRSDVINQPDAPTCSFTYEDDTAPAVLGDPLRVVELVAFDSALWADPVATWADGAALWGGAAEVEVPRFDGYVDSLVAHELGGDVVSWDVGCVGWQAKLGYLPINISRPVESDAERVTRIGVAAGIDLHPVGDPTVMLAAKLYEDVDALSALHEVCASSGGLLWQGTDGRMMYGTSTHRETFTETATFDCDVISDGLEWGQDTGQIINSVTAKWATGEATHQDTDSIAEPWGLRHQDVTTIAEAEADAEQLALLILRRRAHPYWSSPSVVVFADELDQPGLAALSQVEVSSMVVLPLPLDAPGPTPSAPSLGVVEGWVETWDTSGHTVQLAVSDAARWNYIVLRDWARVALDTWGDWATGDWMGMLIEGPTP